MGSTHFALKFVRAMYPKILTVIFYNFCEKCRSLFLFLFRKERKKKEKKARRWISRIDYGTV
jgi:hypothetical protein